MRISGRQMHKLWKAQRSMIEDTREKSIMPQIISSGFSWQ